MQPVNQLIDLDDYEGHPRNYNRHPDQQIQRIMASLRKFGQPRSIVVHRGQFLAGHGVAEAARRLGWKQLRADVLPDDYPEHLALAYVVADNELSRQSDPDQAALAAILQEVGRVDAELVEAAGFGKKELADLLASLTPPQLTVADPGAQTDRAEELQEKWETADNQLWRIGEHFVICGDCRSPDTWGRLLDAADVEKVNGVFTSPPYAEQRKEQYGGIPTAEYVDWWEAVQANVRGNLAGDGSFFVNIKPHCEDGQRALYVMDLVTAMVRRWGWRYVEEACWVHQGFPGEPQQRFQNAFEPIYMFSQGKVKFCPENVAYESDSVMQYEPGLNVRQRQRSTGELTPMANVKHSKGKAYPRNVLQISSATADVPEHAAAFPVALPDFFIRAYSDPGDVWCDPFLGSGTTIVAAHQNKRRGLGIEKLPKYVAVILERLQAVVGQSPELMDG